jgi:hypothetical protein
MTKRPLIIYYECLENGIDASFSTMLDDIKVKDVDTATIDSFSDVYQLQVAKKGMAETDRLLLIADSRIGQQVTGLTPLLNELRRRKGQLYWVGDHPFADKALKMVAGEKVSEPEFEGKILEWINRS